MKKILLIILVCSIVLTSAGYAIFFYKKYQQSEEINHYHTQVNQYLIWNNNIRNKIHFDIAQLGGETLNFPYPNYTRIPGFSFKWFVEVPHTEEKAFESYASGLEDYYKKHLTLLVKSDILSKPDIRVCWVKKDRPTSNNGILFNVYEIEVTFKGMTYLPLNAKK